MRAILLVLAILGCSGCGPNAREWMFPDESKAIIEKQQAEELVRQNEYLRRQTEALERMADCACGVKP